MRGFTSDKKSVLFVLTDSRQSDQLPFVSRKNRNKNRQTNNPTK